MEDKAFQEESFQEEGFQEENFKDKKRKHRIWKRIVSVLACIVVFCTTYALILPAITLDKSTKCGKPEHTHSDECYTQLTSTFCKEPVCSLQSLKIHKHTQDCYDSDNKAVCGFADFLIHTHDLNCYDEEGNLWCPLTEASAHTHDDSCYDKKASGEADKTKLICEKKELALHIHTDACYAVNEDGSLSEKLTCGKTQILEHQHTSDCFKTVKKELDIEELTCEIPAGEGAHTHSGENGCYDENGELICEKEESEGHQHGKYCYGIWELTCQMEEHTHTDACKKKVASDEPEYQCGKAQHLHDEHCYDAAGNLTCEIEEHSHSEKCLESASQTEELPAKPEPDIQPEVQADPTTETTDAVAPVAETTGNNTQSYGHNEDGSIYWNATFGLVQVNAIETNKPYVIFGLKQNKMMTTTPYYLEEDTAKEFSYFGALSKDGISDFAPYCYWCFEDASTPAATEPPAVDNTGKHYIYYLGENGEKKYVSVYKAPNDSSWQNTPRYAMKLTTNVADAAAFKVQPVERNGMTYITVLYQADGLSYYINSAKEDVWDTTHFSVYKDNDDPNSVSGGSLLRLYKIGDTSKETANKVKTEKSANTKINLFDYWSAPNRFDTDDTDIFDGGINRNHNLKFYKRSQRYETDLKEYGTMNILQAHSVLNQGMVSKTLDGDGYPVLSGDQTVTGGADESLAYLFNPKIEHEGKVSYSNLDGLLRVNSEGYYYYSSQETMAEFQEDKSEIVVYDRPGVKRNGDGDTELHGQFFPFNDAPQVVLNKSADNIMNHYFGLTITTRFIQQHNGCSDLEGKTPTVFSFSGDDDVWIYIDDVLVADLGGAHDSVAVDINFQTGIIEISRQNGDSPREIMSSHTLREAFEAAGRLDTTSWRDENDDGIGEGDTFADNTTHTLKFFYMERGNWDSNLLLKYNLVQIPETSIYKVDEWDQPVEGAEFAVYAADESYNMLSNVGGTPVNVANPEYDSDKNIVDESGKVIAKALYTGITNVDGAFTFVDKDGMPLSIKELEMKFGSHFILRETKVPEGYRYVMTDVHLRVFHGQNQLILVCDNSKKSGARASTNLQVTVPEILRIRDGYKRRADSPVNAPAEGSKTVNYYNIERRSKDGTDGTSGDTAGNIASNVTGTLFAVIFKYTGARDESGNIAVDSLQNDSVWTPLYGSDNKGYTLIDMSGEKNLTQAAIEAAKKMYELHTISEAEAGPGVGPEVTGGSRVIAKDDGVIFKPSDLGTMQLTIEDLPGHVINYYRMLKEEERAKTKYTVAYYWTDQSSLETADPENTYRVDTYAQTVDGQHYKGFERVFGANIHVPNLINDVYIQKMDETGSGDGKLNGAVFSLYRVKAQTRKNADGETVEDIYYYTNPKDENSECVMLEEGKYEINLDETQGAVGTITTDDGKVIIPAQTETTHDFEDGIHKGSARFYEFLPGQYIIKEIKAPEGYQINPADIKLVATEDTIYANAGNAYDGISVGRGPGNLVAPLIQFASEGQLDNTLTWIYSQMRVSKSQLFADVGDKSKIDGYLIKDKSNKLSPNEADAARAYMRFETTKNQTIYNYTPNLYRTAETGAQNPTGTRRLFTTVGWPYYEIYQDFDYGSKAKSATAEYDDWSDEELTHLFSRSTYIRVVDVQENAASIKKVDEWNQPVEGAEFAVYAADESYNMRFEKGGELVDAEKLKNSTYDSNKNILDENGNVIAKALYTGVTNVDGEFIFTNKKTGLVYSIREIENKFGEHFILRETKPPDGYRYVSKDIHVNVFLGNNNRRVLRCDNSFESGARSSSTMKITATDTIHLMRPYAATGSKEVELCDSENKVHGTLFAVFYKYTGNQIDSDGNLSLDAFSSLKDWSPLYGNDESGYTMINVNEYPTALDAAIKAALEMTKFRDRETTSIIFRFSEGAVRLTLQNLPGNIIQYYHMLSNADKGKARYTVAYYWTDAENGLEGATKDNTYQVESTPQIYDGHYYGGFQRAFSTEVHIPNLINEAFVQKMDETGREDGKINGATFSLYRVKSQKRETSDGKTVEDIFYYTNPNDENSECVKLEEGKYKINTDETKGTVGTITTDDGKVIVPYQTDVTHNFEDGIHKGTARFAGFPPGQYIIKEVKAPKGYQINTTDIKLVATEDTTYANAGTEDDGISVGRGPGNLVAPLIQFASEGQLDETLTWIYSQMRVSKSQLFADFGKETGDDGYLTKNMSGEISANAADAARAYMIFKTEKKNTVFNYAPNEARTLESGAQNPTGSRRLFTTVGWPYYEIYQDFDYGSVNKIATADYENMANKNLMHLFSRTTYIRVINVQETTLTVHKVDGSNKDVGLPDAKFRLYRLTGNGSSAEYYALEDIKDPVTGEVIRTDVVWTADAQKALVVTSGEDGLADKSFIKLKDGEYFLEEIKAPDGFSVLPNAVKLKLEFAKLSFVNKSDSDNGLTIDSKTANDNTMLYTVTIPNSTGYELPETGGFGTEPYILGGLLLCAVGVLLMLARLPRRRKEDFSPD